MKDGKCGLIVQRLPTRHGMQAQPTAHERRRAPNTARDKRVSEDTNDEAVCAVPDRFGCGRANWRVLDHFGRYGARAGPQNHRRACTSPYTSPLAYHSTGAGKLGCALIPGAYKLLGAC
jgi:hypothetical protein